MKLQFLADHVRRYRGALALIAAIATGEALAMLALPWLAGQVLGQIFAPGPGSITQSVVLLVAGLVTVSVLNAVATIVSAATSSRILADLRERTHGHVMGLPLSFHDRCRQGDVLALMSYEVTLLSDFMTATLARVPAMVVAAAGAIVLLFLLDPALALFVPVLMPLAFVVLKIVGRRMRTIGRRMQDAEAGVITLAEQHLTMLPATKAFAVEQRVQADYVAQVERAREAQFAHARLTALVSPTISLVAALAAVALILLGGESLAGADGSPSELFSFFLYAALLTRPVGVLADFYGRFQWAGGTMARLVAVLEEPAEPGYAASVPVEQVRGAIRFDRVSFAYQGREATLQDITLDIAPGEVVALTGDNGAGKSTIVNLLLRFYEPDAGRILLDGQDIASLQVQALRRQMALVPQRALLFDGSVRDNIAFGLPDAPASLDERIVRAAALAQADEFIAKLPEGYDTWIGDNGIRLSGGQRQRIALARALVADPAILIFDEATSMYDIDAELAFVEACQAALTGRTVILITHRPASLALANRVITLAEGRIVDPAAQPGPA